jgi:hypothetical protein
MREPERRKTFRPPESKDTKTTRTALEMIVFRDRLCQGVRRMRGAGLVDVFDDADMALGKKSV